jgi:hypothetical protein
MYGVAQFSYPLRSPGKRNTSLSRAQGQPLPQQGVGDIVSRKQKMQVSKRCARQKRNIFKVFNPCRGDPGGHPR